MVKGRGRLLAAALVVMALGGCAPGSSSEPRSDDKVEHLVTSGPRTGHLFAHGVVRRGQDPVPHAKVAIALWPEPEDLEIGDEVETWDKQVSTDTHGRWAVRIDPDTIPSRYFPVGAEFVNFDYHVVAGKKVGRGSTTVTLLERPRVWRTEDSRPGDEVIEISVDLQARELAVTDSRGKTERSPLFAE